MSVANYALGTITQVTPPRVLLDGHANDVPAAVLADATIALDDRVAVLVRTPLKPLVLGTEA